MALPRWLGDRELGGPPRTAPTSGEHELRPARSSHLGTGTLACPACDIPVALAADGMRPTDRMTCPFCRHTGAARDFLSLASPTRPARVEVRVVSRRR